MRCPKQSRYGLFLKRKISMATPSTTTPKRGVVLPTRSFDELPDSALVPDLTVAELLSCHRTQVWRMARDGKLPRPIKIGANSTRWRVGEIRAALGAMETTPAPKKNIKTTNKLAA
jgi:predicted DNA-binding transcriptional regulator AlpA